MVIHMAKSKIFRGYTPLGTEITNERKDWNESVDFGLDLSADHPDFPAGSYFLAACSLPNPRPDVFVFDASVRLMIAVSEPAWRSITAAGLVGVTSGDLWVIRDTAVEDEPELPCPEEFDWVL